jgi:hypothetical protein
VLCSPGRKPPPTAAARSAFERFSQLAGNFTDCGIHGALHDLGGLGECLVEPLLDSRLADRDEPRLVSGELLSRLAELLAGQGPPARSTPG